MGIGIGALDTFVIARNFHENFEHELHHLHYAALRRSQSAAGVAWLGELFLFDNTTWTSRTVVREQVFQNLNSFMQIHQGLKYGDEDLHLRGSMGRGSTQEDLIVQTTCNPYASDRATITCRGMDFLLSAFSFLSERALLAKDSQLTERDATYSSIPGVYNGGLKAVMDTSIAEYQNALIENSRVSFLLLKILIVVFSLAMFASTIKTFNMMLEVKSNILSVLRLMTLAPKSLISKNPRLIQEVEELGLPISEFLDDDTSQRRLSTIVKVYISFCSFLFK